MISSQTLRVCREGKPVSTFPDHALDVRQRIEMTRHPLAISCRAKLRLLGPAAIEYEWAAGMETASLGWIDRARHIALEDQGCARGAGLRHRYCREQSLGVGMLR